MIYDWMCPVCEAFPDGPVELSPMTLCPIGEHVVTPLLWMTPRLAAVLALGEKVLTEVEDGALVGSQFDCEFGVLLKRVQEFNHAR